MRDEVVSITGPEPERILSGISKTARNRYDRMTKVQKERVTNYQSLVNAEKQIAELIQKEGWAEKSREAEKTPEAVDPPKPEKTPEAEDTPKSGGNTESGGYAKVRGNTESGGYASDCELNRSMSVVSGQRRGKASAGV